MAYTLSRVSAGITCLGEVDRCVSAGITRLGEVNIPITKDELEKVSHALGHLLVRQMAYAPDED